MSEPSYSSTKKTSLVPNYFFLSFSEKKRGTVVLLPAKLKPQSHQLNQAAKSSYIASDLLPSQKFRKPLFFWAATIWFGSGTKWSINVARSVMGWFSRKCIQLCTWYFTKGCWSQWGPSGERLFRPGILADQLTHISSRGVDYAHHITICPNRY